MIKKDMRQAFSNCPKDWISFKVSKVFENISLTGKKLKKKEYLESGDLPVIDQGQKFIAGYTNNRNLEISCSTPCIIFGDHTKILKFVNFNFVAGADGVKVMKPFKIFNPKLFFYFLKAVQLPDKGYARHFQYLVKATIPLPPLPEQHKIVEKIEELFTKLDAGVEALKKVRKQIKQYRQSVLKSAFEGKLTAEWRQRMLNDELRILNEKEGLKIDDSELKELPKLPESWKWVRLGTSSVLITKGESPKWQGYDYVNEGIPFIRSENVLWGRVDCSEIVKIPEKFHSKLKRSQLKNNDVLINIVGASIGRCAILPASIKRANINQAVAVIRVNKTLVSTYLMHLLLSTQMQRRISENKVETARPNISLTDLKNLIIPLPSLREEQFKIVEEIEKRFSIADEVEKTVIKNLEQAEKLRQSILKKAFEGKLTEKWRKEHPELVSGENSAEKLLEKIKKEKAKIEAELKIKKKNKKEKRKQRRLFEDGE